MRSPTLVAVFLVTLLCTAWCANYAVDLVPQGATVQGYVQLPTISGIDDNSALSVDFFVQASLSASNNPLITLNAGSLTADPVNLALVNGNQLRVTLGTATGTVSISSNAYTFATGTWYTATLTISGTSVSFGVINRASSAVTDLGTFTNAAIKVGNLPRTGFLGYYNGAGLNGLIDNFYVWSTNYNLATLSQIPTSDDLPAAYAANNIVFFLFNEGFGDSAFGTSEQALTATLGGQATFNSPVGLDQMQCAVSGDPHVFVYNWDSVPPSEWGVEWAPNNYYLGGGLVIASCVEVFEARSYPRVTPYWWPSVHRILSYRAYDHFFLVSVNEGGFSQGAYHRFGESTTWTRLSSGSFVDSNNVFYSWDGSNFRLQVPNVGYVTINSGSEYLNFNLYLNKNTCPKTQRPSWGVCDHTLTYGNVQFLDWKYGPEPADPRPIAPENPCAGAQALATAAEELCRHLYAATGNIDINKPLDMGNQTSIGGTPAVRSGFIACILDVCASGDPDMTGENPPSPQCQLDDFTAAQAGVSQISCPSCLNSCSFKGSCNSATGVCSCSAGWTGPDCGVPTNFDCAALDLKDGVERNVQAYSSFVTQSSAALANKFAIQESVVIFPITRRASAAWDAALTRDIAIVANSAEGAAAGSANVVLTFNTIGSATATGGVIAGNTATFPLTWTANSFVVGIITGLPDGYNATIKITSSSGVSQLLLGTGTGRAELDVFKVPSAMWNTGVVSLSNALCTSDPCSNVANDLNTCANCAANAQCGYCVDNGRCMRGSNAGPIWGTCRNWRYSFDDSVSRRLTSVFGTPVTPVETEVFLTTNAASPDREVPVDIRITAGNVQNVWDILVLLEANSGAEVSSITGSMASLLNVLNSNTKYPDVALGFARYGSTVSVLQDMMSLSANNLWVFQRALSAFSLSSAEATNTQLQSLGAVAPTSTTAPSWRTNARKMVVIQTSHAASLTGLAAVRKALIDGGVMPVFVVNDASVKSGYTGLVSALSSSSGLGFGLVIDANPSLNDLHVAIQRALRLATGQVAVVVGQSQEGHIDQATLGSAEQFNIYGLNSAHRARIIVPFVRNGTAHRETVLNAIGYGYSKVEDIETDKPWAKDFTVTGDESSVMTVVIQGNTFRNLLTAFPVIPSAPVVAGGFAGTLYVKFANGTRGPALTYPYTVVHPSGHVFFVPQPFKHSHQNPDGSFNNFATITYHVYDGCVNSGDYTINVIVKPIDDPPSCDIAATNVAEDGSVTVTITYDYDPDYDPVNTWNAQITSWPAHGTLSVAGTNYTGASGTVNCSSLSSSTSCNVVYYPAADYNGADQFAVKCLDNTGKTNSTIGRLTVTPVNDVPKVVAAAPYFIGKEDTWIPVTFTVSDPADTAYPTSSIVKLTYLVAASNGSIYATNGSTTPIIPGSDLHVSAQAPYDVTVWFKGNTNAFTCSFGQTPNVDCSFPPYMFTVRVTDTEGLSADVNGYVHVARVEDPPTADAKSVSTAEDIAVDVTLSGTNNEDVEVLTWSIRTFPSFSTLWSGSTQLTVGAPNFTNPVVTIKTAANQHGSASPWDFDSFTYSAFDTRALSPAAMVQVSVSPVNDAPVPTTTTIVVTEDVPLVFALAAVDIDTPEAQLTYVITVLPDAANYGSLYTYDSAATNNVGQLIDTVPFTVTKTSGVATLVFVPVANYWGNDASFTYTVTDVDVYGLTPAFTVAQVTAVKVMGVNDAPLASSPTLRTTEDTPAIFTLTGTDPWYNENDPLDTYIDRVPYTQDSTAGCRVNTGSLYQYDATLALTSAAYAASGVLIANGDRVTDTQFRVVYVPAPNMNSDVTGPLFQFVQPFVDFHVKETSSNNQPYLLASSVVALAIRIDSVNDAPFIVPAPAATPLTACVSNCQFDQNLGVTQYFSNIGFEQIYFGGDDIEKQALTPLVISVEASPQAQTFSLSTLGTNGQAVVTLDPSTISAANPFVVPVTIDLAQTPFRPDNCNATAADVIFRPGLAFTPGRNEHTGAENPFYIRISYILRDSMGATSDVATPFVITINIREVNQPPYADILFRSIDTFENTPKAFRLLGTDVDNDGFLARISLPCTPAGTSRGTIQVLDDMSNVVQTLSCNGAEVLASSLAYADTLGIRYWNMLYTPAQDDAGANIKSISFTLEDTGSAVTTYETFTIMFSVFRLNAAPNMSIADDVFGSASGDAIPFAFTVTDSDMLENGVLSDDYNMQIVIAYNGSALTLASTDSTLDVSANPLILNTGAATLNTLLNSLYFTANISGVFPVTITLDDQGNTGYCTVDGDEDRLTPCVNSVNKTVNVHTANGVATSAIVGGAVTAAGLGAAAAVAAALLHKFAKKEEETYSPWEVESEDSVVDNPLYQASTSQGSNPLFVGSS